MKGFSSRKSLAQSVDEYVSFELPVLVAIEKVQGEVSAFRRDSIYWDKYMREVCAARELRVKYGRKFNC